MAATEFLRCCDSFEYTAKNYFWIIDKDRHDCLFDLWPSQEIILERMGQLKARGKAQKIQVIKARQIGCSQLVEGLIAWRSMFFENQNSLVVADVESRSTYLFGLMTHMYDMMPWWLKPMCRTRKYDEGLHFANPDIKSINASEGLNSKIIVASARDLSGVGTGFTLTAAHGSEYCLWAEDKAKSIITGEMLNALVESPETIAVLESTANGAGRFAHSLWTANVDLEERAQWDPVFIPFFFEKTRFLAPEQGWKVGLEEQALREKVKADWLQCPKCGSFREKIARLGRSAGQACTRCESGVLQDFIISDGQLCWMWNRRINADKQNPDALRKLREDMCSTAEEAFQVFGTQIFPEDAQSFAQLMVREPIATGFFDSQGQFHGVRNPAAPVADRRCYLEGCATDHTFDEKQLKIWAMAHPSASYVAGVDVAHGIGGEGDYSTVVVNRVGIGQVPDEQVLSYRCNTIDPESFGDVVVAIGKMYNNALLAIEYNIQGTGNRVRIFHQYPNIYRWIWPDSQNVSSTKFHWITQEKTKQRMHSKTIRALRQRTWIVRDRVIVEEMKTYHQDDPGSVRAGAAAGKKDDLLIAGMIAICAAHEMDVADGSVPPLPMAQSTSPLGEFEFTCSKCGNVQGGTSPNAVDRCGNCHSAWLSVRRRAAEPINQMEMRWPGDAQNEDPGDPSVAAAMDAIAQEHF